MDKDPKTIVDGGEENKNMTSLADEPSYEEHMAKNTELVSKTVGNIYGKIAKEALGEAGGQISESSFDDLENIIGAKSSVEAACKSISKRLGTDPSELINAVLYGENDVAVFGEMAEKVRGNELVDNYEFVFSTLSDVHDQWIKNNEKKFFDPARQDRLYQFAPLSLIGAEEASSDLLFVEPILEAIGNKNDLSSETFKDEYYDWAEAEDIKHERNVIDHYDYVDEGPVGTNPLGYGLLSQLLDDPKMVLEACSDKIINAVKNNKDLALNIARQIIIKFGDDLYDFENESVAELIYGEGRDEDDGGKNGNNDPYFTSSEYINDGWD